MKFTKFNRNWKFWEIKNSFALNWAPPEDARVLDLPHDAMIEIPQDPDSRAAGNTGYRKGGVFCYSRTFFAGSPDRTYILKIDGAYMNAFVFVNGQLAAKRPYGYAVFYVPLNDYLEFGKENEIRIQVRSGAEPNSRWYPGTGLYRDVYLLEAGPQYIKPDSVQIKTLRIPAKQNQEQENLTAVQGSSETASGSVPDPAESTSSKGVFTVKTDSLTVDRTDYTAAEIQVSAVIASGTDGIPGSLEILITDAAGKTAATALVPISRNTGSDASAASLSYAIPMQGFENARPLHTDYYPVNTVISVPHPYLWDIDTPNLYTCTLRLKSVSGDVLDSHIDTFGIRTLSVSPEEGLLVNGTSVKLRGACIHHDSGILGAKTFEETHIRQIRKLKESGFNAVRSAHNPAAPALLNACDKVGMFVMDEAFDMWTRHKSDYDYGMFFEEWWEADIESMVHNAFNHPSVLMYSIGNEIPEIGTPQGGRIARMLCEKIKSMDDSRFTLASVNGIFSVGDSLGQIVADVASDLQAQGKSDGNVNDFMAFMHQYMNDMTTHPIVDATISVPFQYTDIAGYNYMGSRYDIEGALHPERVIVGSETGIGDLCYNWSRVKRLPNVIGDFCWTGWEYLGEAGIGAANYSRDNNPFGNARFPMQISGTGCIDITGHRLPMSYYREIVFGLRKDPYIAVQDPAHYGDELIRNPWIISDAIGSWSFDEYTGKPVVIEVYSDAEEVELFKNGVSLGRQQAGEPVACMSFFETTYEPGTLTAVSYINGAETGRYEVISAGKELQLTITAEPVYSTEIPVLEHPEEKEDIFAGLNQYFAAKDPMQANQGISGLTDKMMSEYQAAGIRAKVLTEQLKAAYLNGNTARPELVLDIRQSSLLQPGTAPGQQEIQTSPAENPAEPAEASEVPEEISDSYEIRFLNIEITDENGIPAYGHDTDLHLSVEGTAQVLGFGSADPFPAYNYTEMTVKTWQGRAQLILKTNPSADPSVISLTSDSGLSCSMEIR